MKTTLLAVAGAVVLLFLILLIGGCRSYNGLVDSRTGVDAQWSQVQNVYQRRADLIPNLVKTVEGAANFEKSTLTEVVNARASVGQVKMATPANAQEMANFEQAQGRLSSALSRLLVVSENYPTLKANANFVGLQSQLEGSENRIAVERGKFNEVVGRYNAQVRRFPAVLYAGAMGFQPREFFQAKPGADQAPAVDFNFNKTAPAKP